MATAPKTAKYFEIYQRRRQELLGLANEQLGIVSELGLEKPGAEGTRPGDVVRGLIGRLGVEQLRVLVIGRFSAGKSTFLNALFGQVILPASPTPTTGVLCQIRYADEAGKKAILYPKAGMGKQGSSAPFEVRIGNLQEELGKYVKIDHFGDAEATSRYQKLELYWPLELCKNGVELIDSIGLDDPDSRDAITLEYAESADAILYCMKSQDAFSAKDKQVLGVLRSLGYESIFFVITYYDHVKESAALGQLTEDEFKRLQRHNLAPLTELGNNGIKYVDSKSALLGRMKGDRELLDSSGMVDVEEALGAFLTEEKGRAKLLTSLRSLRTVNRGLRKVFPAQIGMWQTSVSELEKRYSAAEWPLKLLETTRQAMIASLEGEIKDVGRASRDLAEVYFQDLPEKVKGWAVEYEIQGKLGFPPRKATIEPLVHEVMDHLKTKIAEETGEWNRTVLSPMINANVSVIQEKLEGKAREFVQHIDKLRVQISVGDKLNEEEISSQKDPSFLGRLLGLGFALATGDVVTGGIGMVVGPKAMLNTIVLQVIAGVLLAVFGMLNPAAIITAAIAAILGGNFINVLQLKANIKKSVGEKLAEELSKQRVESSKAVQTKVEEQVKTLRDALDAGLAGEITNLRAEVEAVLDKQRRGRSNAEQEIAKLRRLDDANQALEEKIDLLMDEAGIGKR